MSIVNLVILGQYLDLPLVVLYHLVMNRANKNRYREEKARFEVILSPGEKQLLEEARTKLGVTSNRALLKALLLKV